MKNTHTKAYIWCIFNIGLSIGLLMVAFAGRLDLVEMDTMAWIINILIIVLFYFALKMSSVAMICLVTISVIPIIGFICNIGTDDKSSVIGSGIYTFLNWFVFFNLKSNGKTAFQLASDRRLGNNEFQNSFQNTSTTKKCPYCAEEIKKEAVVCRFCNRDLV